MRILFIECPSRGRNTSPPYGILYAAGVAERLGHNVCIVDYSNDPFSFEALTAMVKDYAPDVVAFGGITPSYRNLKKYALFLRSHYP